MNTLQNEIIGLAPWFHNIHLPDGTETAPNHELGDFPHYKWVEIAAAIPQDLQGWKVCDIGCNAGFYSVELARRGGVVTAVDMDSKYLEQAAWVVKKFGLEKNITLKLMQVYELAHTTETFDLIWFMGVFYHLRYPLLVLDILSRLCTNLMVFQTLTLPAKEEYEQVENISLFGREVMNQAGWPKMAFVEKYLAGDPTNWWVPTHTAIEALLRSTGFRVLCRPSDEVYICQRDGTLVDKKDLREQEYRAAIGYTIRK